MAKKRLLWQLYPSYLLVVVVALAAFGFVAAWAIGSAARAETGRRLEHAVAQLQSSLPARLDSADPEVVHETAREIARASGVQLWVVRASGEVLADSEHAPGVAESMARREEVRTALAGIAPTAPHVDAGRGVYAWAAPVVRDGQVVGAVRGAVSAVETQRAVWRERARLAAGAAAIGMVAGVICLAISRRASRPFEEIRDVAERFAQGQLDEHLAQPESEEMAGLAGALNAMARQLEDRLRTIVHQSNEQQAVLTSMAEGVLAVDSEERLLTLNTAAAELVGNSLAEPLGRKLHEVVRNVDLRRFASRALAANEPIEDDVVLHGDPDRVLQVRGTALRDASGQTIGAVVVLSDITHFRRLETIRRDFVANVSHELKTPITSIKGFVETLLDGALESPDDARRFLRIVATQADRLNAIIEDLLALSKIEQSEQADDLAVEDARLRDVLDAVLHDCGVKAEERHVRLRLECDEAIIVRVNPPLVEQAVNNLVDNAIKYSEQGDEVRIVASASDADVAIAVSDDGCGIDAEHLPRLFERFYRVDKARSRKLGGTGLGLAIVKHIVQAHQGRITVESTPGVGTTFRIHLPRR